MRYLMILSIIVLMFSCSSSPNEEYKYLVGKWSAKWEIDSSVYPDSLNNKSFTMNGIWEFNDLEKMSITTFGYKGCIFGEDTLSHTQNWRQSNDTIYLSNNEKVASLTCKIISQSEAAMRVQLYDDIFVNLAKE